MIETNTDRRRFKAMSKEIIEKFTSINIKRMSTFGNNGCIVWCGNNLHKNTHIIIYVDRDILHIVSDYKIIFSIRL